ncbi:hypothetical protein GOP47_0000605 [Adiantum capillus-veneris]|uniref:3-hydroxyisobutyryl-CoA hydrolase n=1 Tax=Adiantum capillus-veneris TaxID=13818 RepID=A0A9D4VDB2_ADICA|nr:hypothetical protein GOP47_0000605 [Adiantum capillus-veneris]
MVLPTSRNSGSSNHQEILIEECGWARVVILNRQKQLNALSHWMVEHLKGLYEMWEIDNGVSLIIMKGAGRAFCAGGDVAATYHYGNAGQYSQASNYFYTEYTLNYIIGTCKKPYVALLDGIVMGGGAGVSIHGAIRVVTEKTVFSMPETALGLHPDVGASFFLSRVPGYLGEYLALTGARLDGADMVGCGLATHFVPSQSLPDLEKALLSLDTASVEDISALIEQFTVNVKLQEKSPLHRSAEINRCFSKVTVEEILEALSREGDNCYGWYKASAESLRKASPVSLKITLKSIREGRHQSLADCLIREYRLSVRCVSRKLSNDLYEGIRSILIDKDRNPKWDPPSLELTSPEIVNYYFAPLKAEEGQELRLPIRRDMKKIVSRL